MARQQATSFEMVYKTELECAIRGFHVYQKDWTPFEGEKLFCKPDSRIDARRVDGNAMGVYQDESTLVGHLPVELSLLMRQFLGASSENCINVRVLGKKKKEVGLDIPGKYIAITKDKKIWEILNKQLREKNATLKNFQMEILNCGKFPIYA